MAARSNYHHGDLREALLEAGEAVLAERGLKGFTLRECARRAGVSHAAPKHHFNDTEGFLTQIAVRGYRRLTEMLQDEIALASDLDQEYVATTRAYSRFATEWSAHFRIMFRYDLLDGRDNSLNIAIGHTLTELTNVILRQRGEPEITIEALDERVKTEDLIEDILIGWSHIHGFAHLKLEGQLRFVPQGREDEFMSRATARLARLVRRDKGD